MTKEEIIRKTKELSPWFQNIHLIDDIYTLGALDTEPRWRFIKNFLPKNFTGMRVLDVGCNAGIFSIKAKELGADYVLGIDFEHYIKQANFIKEVKQIEGVKFSIDSIYTLSTPRRFDLTLCLGVLYHLKYPFLALKKISELTTEIVLLETETLTEEQDADKMKFIEHTYRNDGTNWWIYGEECLKSMLRSVGFKFVKSYHYPDGHIVFGKHYSKGFTEEGIKKGRRTLLLALRTLGADRRKILVSEIPYLEKEKEVDSNHLYFYNNAKLFVDNNCWERLGAFRRPFGKITKTAEQLFAEIKNYLIKHKVEQFEFADYCNLDLSELDRMCEMIIRDKLNIEWSAPAVVNSNMNGTIFDRMRKSGCKKLIFDLLSGSNVLLNRMGANFTADGASKLLRMCHQEGIAAGVSLIFAHPQETKDDFNETINFLTDNISFIDEIAKITYCLSNYLHSTFSALPLCRYWTRCLDHNNRKDSRESFSIDFNSSISRIFNIGMPVVFIEPDEVIFDYLKEVDNYVLRSRKLHFYFDRGKGRLFWGRTQLTDNLGLYTSIFAAGFWQDSEHADWRVTKISEIKMVLKGKWQFLPIIQTWEIELKDETIINLKIEMEVLEQVEIEGEQQTNIMLRNEYTKWIFDNGFAGNFPHVFNEYYVTLFENDISVVNTIRAEAKNDGSALPSVALNHKLSGKEYRMSALNSSSFLNTRVLKCYKINKKTCPPGKYFYFEGKVKINSLT